MYEIEKSCSKGNGLLGVYIHNIKDANGYTDTKGFNPLYFFDRYGKRPSGLAAFLSVIGSPPNSLADIYPTYDWVLNDGYNNIGDWMEGATINAGR